MKFIDIIMKVRHEKTIIFLSTKNCLSSKITSFAILDKIVMWFQIKFIFFIRSDSDPELLDVIIVYMRQRQTRQNVMYYGN